jgi:hypothetical protein
MPSKLVWLGSDTHCGHDVGLTPPKFQANDAQKVYWDAFAHDVNQFRKRDKIHLACWNADLIDGRGERSGGTELWTTDRAEQVDCAAEVVKYVNARHNVFTFGTPYHVGQYEDWEKQIAHMACFKENGKLAPIGGQQFFTVNKTTFHMRHKIGNSSVPHGKFTALARQKVWNLFWADCEEVPKADVFIRAHRHSFAHCGEDNWLAMVLPALQGWGSKYGERQCEGTVHFGFVGMLVSERKELPQWKAYIRRDCRRVSVLKY